MNSMSIKLKKKEFRTQSHANVLFLLSSASLASTTGAASTSQTGTGREE